MLSPEQRLIERLFELHAQLSAAAHAYPYENADFRAMNNLRGDPPNGGL